MNNSILKKIADARVKMVEITISDDARFMDIVDLFHKVNDERRKRGKHYFITDHKFPAEAAAQIEQDRGAE